MSDSLPRRVRIVEVGPRDGLQNEPERIPTEAKIEFIQKLAAAGLRDIEATSFVHPQVVPQLADAFEVVSRLTQESRGVQYSALVPNRKGLARALEAGIRRVAVFTAASETFTQKNIRMSIAESLGVFADVVREALDAGVSVRGYVSTCFVCPYEGEIPKDAVVDVARKLLEIGVDEVSISDTIGAAAPTDVTETVGHVLKHVPPEKIALHFHDTYGTALANVYAGLKLGIATFDASAGGLGGCPFAPGAAGNLATEDLVYMLGRMGIETGVDLKRLLETSRSMSRLLNRPLPSRQLQRIQPHVECSP